jgi:glycine oxidase
MAEHPDVLIVGGGVIGLTTAYFLAKEGLRVEVLERGAPGAEASWAGAGIIPPGNSERAASPYDQLRASSSRMFGELSRELRETTGIDNGYRVCGGVEFLEADDAESLPAWRAEGVEFEALSEMRVPEVEPLLAPRPGGYYLPGMAQVRNPWHLRALIAACERVGVRIRDHCSVERFERRGSTVTGVRLADGTTCSAGRYLLAAGAWSDTFLAPFGVRSGIHPVRGQIVLLRTSPAGQRIVLVGKNYFVPREDGHVLVGATEEPEAGFEKRTSAAAVAGLIAFAGALAPALARAEVVTCWAGLRPGSADGLPSLGSVGDCRNLFLAGGHYRAGIQLSPATARVLTDLLTGKPPTIPLDDFRPGRVPGKPFRPAFRS